ncbi:MAG: hypothetical protein FWG40_10040 [Peptococcaceae bacterium]|nr:hypothetical protein [Peptococcaceae bacterium]
MPYNEREHIGYWFAGQSAIAALETGHSPASGLRIKNADEGPPWMVVNKEIQTVIVASGEWPGSLWLARVIKLGDMSGLIANPRYWRASEIELLEEVPIGMLFGYQGERVVPLLNQIMTLTSSEVDELQANSMENSDAEDAYAHAWSCWNENLMNPRSHIYDDGMILASPGNHDKEMSPINYGFSLIHSLVWQRAREIEGEEAFIEYIEYGETEISLNQRWNSACAAFLYEAMALSMSQYLSADECSTLTKAWSAVFGQGK